MSKQKTTSESENTENSPVEAESDDSTKGSTESTNAPQTQSGAVEFSGDAGKFPLQPCPACKSESVKACGEPDIVNYRGLEHIYKVLAKCKECQTIYHSRMSIPIR